MHLPAAERMLLVVVGLKSEFDLVRCRLKGARNRMYFEW